MRDQRAARERFSLSAWILLLALTVHICGQTTLDTSNSFTTSPSYDGNGLTTIVLAFELPTLGAVANPFLSADLGVMVHTKGSGRGP